MYRYIILSLLSWFLSSPRSASQNLRLQKPAYFSYYSIKLAIPIQVEWTVTSDMLGRTQREPAWKFSNDIPYKDARARHSDYNRSGYDRGHLCPAADRSADRELMKSTFAMSNIAPQVPSLNRGSWKHSESFIRNAALRFDSVKVYASTIFLRRDTVFIGKHHIAVPHAFFKVAWLPKNDSVIGQWFYFNY